MIAVYKITNLFNGRFYVGCTNNVKHRMGQHFSKCLGHTKLFDEDIAKYGKQGFEVSILEECTLENLKERESYYLVKLQPEYNRIIKGYELEKETKEKISKTLTGRKMPAEIIEKQRIAVKKFWATHKRKPTYGDSKKVLCDGIIYPSMTNLAKVINGTLSGITRAIKRDGKYKGHEVRLVV